MEKQLFRKSSIERVSSPEQLNDYIRVSNPGVWMILAAVIAILIGICAWGIFGRLDTKISTAGACSNGTFTCYVTEEKIGNIKTGTELNVDGKTLSVSEISAKPVEVGADMDGYLLYLGGFFRRGLAVRGQGGRRTSRRYIQSGNRDRKRFADVVYSELRGCL